jgi:hypothetical protein
MLINDVVAQANRVVAQMRPAVDWVEQNKRLFADIAADRVRRRTPRSPWAEPTSRSCGKCTAAGAAMMAA